jgi:uncharacterized membrane protein YphA (DoxX/SURF4 family)
VKKFLEITLRILLAAAFIVSALLKLFPIEPFELSLVEFGLAGWSSTAVMARIVIGAEFLLGGLLLSGIKLHRLAIPAASLLLVLFSIHLLIQLVRQGNQHDCGCFGIYLPMSPVESLVKNLILLSLLLLLMKVSTNRGYRYQNPLAIVLAVISFSLPFIVNPVAWAHRSHLQPESVNWKLPQDLILEQNEFGAPEINLFAGRHIVSFVTLNCMHCRQAALKIHVINQRHPEVSFFFFINGKDERMQDFFSVTKTENIPHLKMNAVPFSKLTGGIWPQIWWVEDGVVVKKSTYLSLNEEQLLGWWNEP